MQFKIRHQEISMTSSPQSSEPVPPDTVEARWSRWVAEGDRLDRIQQRRAAGAFVATASALACASFWLLVLR